MKTDKELNQALKQAELLNWDKANKMLNGYGTETVNVLGLTLKYINLGDTYDITICSETCGKPFIGSWGQWVEDTENEYCENENMIRCGYCGEFTSMNKKDWCEVICGFCGSLVGG